MAESEAEPEMPEPARHWRWRRALAKYLLALPLGLLALLGIAFVAIDSDIGHRAVADALAGWEAKSGLRVRIGRINGSLYGQMQLDNVAVADDHGVFLRLPRVRVDWRPLAWWSRGLDVRMVASDRGVLSRVPAFRVTEPGGPLLPDFNVRIDRLAIERLTLARQVIGVERRIDLHAQVLLRQRRALVSLDGSAGGGDRLAAKLDADELANRFGLALDYAAPKGGLLAALTGADADRRVRAGGKGTWRTWRGALQAEQAGRPLAALSLAHDAGQFALAGSVWPVPLVGPEGRRLLGDRLAVTGAGRLADNVLTGHLEAVGAPSRWAARGALDLGANAARQLVVAGRITDPAALGPGNRALGLHGEAVLDGHLSELAGDVSWAADRLVLGGTALDRFSAHGTFRRDGARWRAPLRLAVGRVTTGNPRVDPELASGHGGGTLVLAGHTIAADDIRIDFPRLSSRLALRGDTAKGGYALAGSVAARGVRLAGIGTGNADARGVLKFGGMPWTLAFDLTGLLPQVENRTIAGLAGDNIRFAGRMALGEGRPTAFQAARVDGSRLALALDGRVVGGVTQISGKGRQATYGAFTIDAALKGDGPHARLVFADPLPAAGVRDMSVALAPAGQGFRVETQGQSALGEFSGLLAIDLPANGHPRIDVTRFNVWKTAITGQMRLMPAGADGDLRLTGGGVDGTLTLVPRDGGQGLDMALSLRDASFGGEQPLTVGEGKLELHGLLARGHTTLSGNLYGAGIGKNRLFLGRVAAKAQMSDGVGQITATLAGRRGSRFELQVLGDIAPGQLAMVVNGNYAGQGIRMPRRARFTAEEGGWRMAPAEIDFAGGRAIASGVFAPGATTLDLALDSMPLALGDIALAQLGLGGTATGLFHYARPREGLPTAEARLLLRGLTRSGLVLTSRPIDLALVGRLSATALDARAVASEGGKVRGRVQARIGALAPSGPLGDRLRSAPLVAQLRYDGPADAIWRLMAIEHFDLTGPLSLAADIGGTLDEPAIQGSLAGNGLRLQSALTGTDVNQIALKGRFNGSDLSVDAMTGRTAGNGQVSGSGSVRFAELSTNRGPSFDIRLGARNALLLSRPDLALAATGPLRILSDGLSGTIAGRLAIDSARWRLGQSQAAAELPNIRTREINRSADVAPASVRAMPWRFLVDAAGPYRIRVSGLGIDSEWGADVRLRGTVDAPAIAGSALLVQGTYEFAGKRFDLTRGRLQFDGTSPPDPRLDIAATTTLNGLTATVTVGGTSLKPDVNFSSIPAMPEEELLSRLLFGDSITQSSAPEALQLGAALASLHGGGGLDPINKLRAAIGLDRLRIVNADPTQNRQTGVAAGKYLGRHFYAEIVTDGRGYSATNIEYRVTGWLSLLGTVSTVGRQSVNARVSKDY